MLSKRFKQLGMGLVITIAAAGMTFCIYAVDHRLPHHFVTPSRVRWPQIEGQPRETPAKYGMPYTGYDVSVDSEAIINVWFVPARLPTKANTVLVLHGWGGCKEYMMDTVRLLHSYGYNVVAYDSRAHGASTGTSCTYGRLETGDFSSVIDETKRRWPDLGRIAVLGVSYGGAVALQSLAKDPRVHCGVVISPFCRLEDVARVHLKRLTPFGTDWILPRVIARAERLGGFNAAEVQPISIATSILQPTLVVHGVNDDLVPISDVEQLFANLRSPHKQWYAAKNSDHDHILQYGDIMEVNRNILDFLSQQTGTLTESPAPSLPPPPPETLRGYHPLD